MPALVTVKELQDLFKDRAAGPQNNEDTLNVASGGASIGVIVQQDYHSLVLLDIEERAQALKRDIVLEPARMLKGSVVGPGGKPVAGITAYGLTFRGSETLKADSFTVQALNPQRPRRLVFLDKDKRLAALVVLRGSQTEPLAIKLQPCGPPTGRIVRKHA